MTGPRIRRRTLLEGMGAAVLVTPFLRSEADAQAGRPGPRRFALVYFSNGRVPSSWRPTGTATDFTLSPTLEPFADLKNDMVVIENIDNFGDPFNEPHAVAFVRLTTGTRVMPGDAATTGGGPSIDQVLATDVTVSGATRIRSLQISADRLIGAGSVGQYVLSHAGIKQPMLPETSPVAIYKRIFDGVGAPAVGAGAPNAALERLRAEKRSVLDFFKKDWKRLHDAAPSAQRPKLDAHFEGIRQLERALDGLSAANPGAGCQEPPDLQERLQKIAAPDSKTLPPDYAGLLRLNLELVRLAFACDVTRVATFLCDTSTSRMTYDGVLPEGRHAVQHKGTMPLLAASERWLMDKLAAWLKTLKATPEGAGSLLDGTFIAVTSEFGVGHESKNVPMLLFGKAGGRIRTGQFLTVKGRYVNDVWFTAMKAFGVPGDAFGEVNKNRGVFTELLV